MTRKTFKRLARGIALAAVMVSASAPAYFVVSVPANALTMSGVGRLNAPTQQARTEPAPPGRDMSAAAKADTIKPARPRSLRAWLGLSDP